MHGDDAGRTLHEVIRDVVAAKDAKADAATACDLAKPDGEARVLVQQLQCKLAELVQFLEGLGNDDPLRTVLVQRRTVLEQQLGEPVDHVYMAKVFYALYQSLQAGELSDANAIAVIHSGGQQGRRGLPER